tara:strand:+ start:51383 stop:52468 length:1086 start_codon:yes stop_codon:yes gene_type:complete
MKNIKVLQLIDSLNVGGAEVLAVNIANGLSKESVKSYLCVTRVEGLLKDRIDLKSVSYLYLSRKLTLDINASRRLINFCKKEKINIIHAHSNSFFMAVIVRIFYSSVKIVWHNHTGNNINLRGLKLNILKVLSYWFEVIINVNNPLNNWSTKVLHSKKNIFINNFPVFQKVTNRTILKGEENKRIVCLAAFRAQKDHLNLLKAFQLLLVNNNDWTLHLVGERKKDAYTESIYAYIKINNLQDHVFIYGVCSDIKNILQQATIGVLSSDSEGLPVALLEYGLSGLPVVTTDVGECGQIINKINTSFLVPKSDSIALFDAINGVIHLTLDERRFFGEKFQRLVMEKYSHNKFIEKLIKIYLNC